MWIDWWGVDVVNGKFEEKFKFCRILFIIYSILFVIDWELIIYIYMFRYSIFNSCDILLIFIEKKIKICGGFFIDNLKCIRLLLLNNNKSSY